MNVKKALLFVKIKEALKPLLNSYGVDSMLILLYPKIRDYFLSILIVKPVI